EYDDVVSRGGLDDSPEENAGVASIGAPLTTHDITHNGRQKRLFRTKRLILTNTLNLIFNKGS
uniref:hypothetical protein n=1 Tax=Endozoicomonas arenosclerae TaxID=1633495 RepID=UPI000AEDF653